MESRFGGRDPMQNLNGFGSVIGFDAAFKQQIVWNGIECTITRDAVQGNNVIPYQFEMGYPFVINAQFHELCDHRHILRGGTQISINGSGFVNNVISLVRGAAFGFL